MKISVIIPVYNAEAYVRNAVESALEQPETAEVLLIEDNSPDNSLQICQGFENEYSRVRLLRHPNGKNQGAGATRNVGLVNAKCDYIAFLDADDFYLPGRFSETKKLFNTYLDIDGVYEAIGVHFDDSDAEAKWLSKMGGDLTTMTERVDSEHLFDALVNGGKGYFHLNGLVVKKSLFDRCGYFFEHLRLHQDTAMTIQMAESGVLIPGRLDTPVAMRRVHNENRFLGEYNRSQAKLVFWETLFYWAQGKNLKRRRLIAFYQKYLYYSYRLIKESKACFYNNSGELKCFGHEFLRHPFLFLGATFQFGFRKLADRTFTV